MADLDTILGTLGAQTPPPALAMIDDGVMQFHRVRTKVDA